MDRIVYVTGWLAWSLIFTAFDRQDTVWSRPSASTSHPRRLLVVLLCTRYILLLFKKNTSQAVVPLWSAVLINIYNLTGLQMLCFFFRYSNSLDFQFRSWAFRISNLFFSLAIFYKFLDFLLFFEWVFFSNENVVIPLFAFQVPQIRQQLFLFLFVWYFN